MEDIKIDMDDFERMEHELIPLETDMQQLESEIQIDILETQSNDAETLPEDPEEQPIKRRKKKSTVWEHFTIEPVGDGCRKAFCKQCNKSYAYSTGSKVSGTSHLKRHIAKGGCPTLLLNHEENNQLAVTNSSPKVVSTQPRQPRRRFHQTATVPYISYDAEKCRREIVRMIIMHDYPLHIVEHPGFVAFVQNLQPRFDMVSFDAIQGDCLATYLEEKAVIQNVIGLMPGRICLTLDLWSSSRTTGYVFIRGQFIDSEWKIHRKLLNVIMEPYPESDAAFSHSIAACLSDWGMDGKLFSVTINQPLSEPAVENLCALLSVRNPLMLKGQLLVGNCLAHSLSGIVQSVLTSVGDLVNKVRDSVKYVKTSESREEKFLELKQHLQVPSSKSLIIDDLTRWDTTYEMLLAASGLKEVFDCLDTSDPDYGGGPSADDWKQVDSVCTHLKPFFDMANHLTSSSAQTTNMFFHEAWKIQLDLARAATSIDPFISSITQLMQEEFDKYWKSCCYILAIAVVMDPRFKMKLVEFSFSKIYGEEAASHVKIVDEGIHELFEEYVALLPLPSSPANAEEANGTTVKQENHEGMSNGHGLMDFDVYIKKTTSQLARSELDQYLGESLLPRVQDLDVIGWWKLNGVHEKYPTLSKMARDILSIPVCTVPAGSVFDTVRKEMDSYKCELRPETVEALICAKEWWLDAAEKVDIPVPVVQQMEVPM